MNSTPPLILLTGATGGITIEALDDAAPDTELGIEKTDTGAGFVRVVGFTFRIGDFDEALGDVEFHLSGLVFPFHPKSFFRGPAILTGDEFDGHRAADLLH